MSETESFEDLFYEFLRSYTVEGVCIYHDALNQLAAKAKTTTSLHIDFNHLLHFDERLADFLLDNPRAALAKMTATAIRYLRENINFSYTVNLRDFTVRVYNIPMEISIRDVSTEHVNKIVAVRCVVARVAAPQPWPERLVLRCTNCGQVTEIVPEGTTVALPTRCPKCKRRVSLQIDEASSELRDVQIVWLEEEPERLEAGQIPRIIEARVAGDLVGKIHPGHRVKVVGIIGVQFRRTRGRGPAGPQFFMEIVYVEQIAKPLGEVEVTEEDIRKFQEEVSKGDAFLRNLIESIAPQLYGLEDLKEAILYQLVGAAPYGEIVPFEEQTAVIRERPDIHILIIGDPATGKTELLRFVSHLVPRGIYATGRAATAAGLTAAVVRDPLVGWMLEVGALVLADQGVVCIDEIDKMRKEDAVILHEAMEKQTITIHKAGIDATLSARCPILAAANPKAGRYDPNLPFRANINLPPTLLERFDLFFVLRDIPHRETDVKIAEKILKRSIKGMPPTPYSLDFMRKFISYVRSLPPPKFTEKAIRRLIEGYLELRTPPDIDYEKSHLISVTHRQLAALKRLAMARARLFLRSEVREEDAEAALNLLRRSLERVASIQIGETSLIDIDRVQAPMDSQRRTRFSLLIRRILEIIQEYEDRGEAAPDKEVIDRLKSEFKEDEIRRAIGELLRSGELWEPEPGKLRRLRY